MTLIDEEAREGSSADWAEAVRPTAQSRAHARDSVARTSSVAFDALTQSARRAVALLDKPGSLAHSQPPTFAQARERHHECAGHFTAPVVKWLRLLWGYVHLGVIKPVLNLLEWVTESPARFLVAAVLVTVVVVWG